jgi:hypothetical protein
MDFMGRHEKVGSLQKKKDESVRRERLIGSGRRN